LLGLLAETTAVQAVGTMAVLAIPAVAPKVAQALEVPASLVGYQVSVLYLAAMLSSLVAGTFVVRWGPCRTSQASMLLMSAGCTLAGSAHVATVLLGSVMIGLAYGTINPASSDLLMRYAPAAQRNLYFSIKQTGVPLGGMAIGLLGPALAIAVGWNAPFWMVAAAGVALALAAQPVRGVLDAYRDPFRKLSSLSFAGFRTLGRRRALLRLALASFFLSAAQLCLMAFLVVLLVEEVHFDLIAAGMILAGVQVAGAFGRIFWGVLADKVGSGLAVLLSLSVIMMISAGAVIEVSPQWSTAAVTAIFVVLGLTAVGWNGVYLSEIARLSPPQAIGGTTGAAMFFTFMGVVVGPPVFSALHNVIGGYARSYALLVVFGLVAAALVSGVRNIAPPTSRL
jgi:MFS family permease